MGGAPAHCRPCKYCGGGTMRDKERAYMKMQALLIVEVEDLQRRAEGGEQVCGEYIDLLRLNIEKIDGYLIKKGVF